MSLPISRIREIATTLGHPFPNTAREPTLRKWVRLATEAQLLGWHPHGGRMTTKPEVIQEWINKHRQPLPVVPRLRGHWRFKTKVNPMADTVDILSTYVRNSHEEHFVLPEDISREERKNYPIQLLEEKLEGEYKKEIRDRILPRLRNIDNAHAKVRFKMKTTMKNSEGEPRNREVHTGQIEINLSRAQERNRIFEAIKDRNGLIHITNFQYMPLVKELLNNGLEQCNPNILNPEIEMNQEDFVSGDSSDYWYLYSINSFELEIEFIFRGNNSNHNPQILTGPIETFIDGRQVSSREWEEANPNYEDLENSSHSQPQESDGNNKRMKARARAKHPKGGTFFPVDCLRHNNSGVINIDNSNEYCFKYSVCAYLHYNEEERGHPNRHKQYEKYFHLYDWSGMNFPVGIKDIEIFMKNNPNIVIKVLRSSYR